jgi:hypothetical protein
MHTHLEEALGAGAPCMDHTLRDALAIELRQLLHQLVVLQQDGPADAHGEGVVVVPYGGPAVGRPVLRVVRTAGPLLAGRGKPGSAWQYSNITAVT